MNSVKVTREEVERFLSVQQPIYSSDYGYSSGLGRGDGSGFGSNDGCGFGSGNSSGPGFGEGSGFGYGDISAYSSVRGGIKVLNGNIVDYIDNIPTIITQVHGNIACGYIVQNFPTLESCFIAKVDNFFAHGKTLKEAVANAKAKRMRKIPIEEQIEKFIKVLGPLDSEHTGKEFYDWHHVLTGSCEMGRDAFCKIHNIDLTKMYSVRYFLDITEETYGGNVIKSIKEEYEKIEK